MKFNLRPKNMNLEEWHPYFVWFPLLLTDHAGHITFIWLQKVQRRYHKDIMKHWWSNWEYDGE